MNSNKLLTPIQLSYLKLGLMILLLVLPLKLAYPKSVNLPDLGRHSTREYNLTSQNIRVQQALESLIPSQKLMESPEEYPWLYQPQILSTRPSRWKRLELQLETLAFKLSLMNQGSKQLESLSLEKLILMNLEESGSIGRTYRWNIPSIDCPIVLMVELLLSGLLDEDSIILSQQLEGTSIHINFNLRY